MFARPPRLLDVTPIDFFNVGGTCERALYSFHPRTADDLVPVLPAADTAADASILKRLEECHAAPILLSCNRRNPPQTPTVINDEAPYAI